MVNRKDLRKAVGIRLKKVRKSLSLTQEQIVSSFDTGRATFSRNEKGETFPNYIALYNLAMSYDVSLDWLICEKGPMFFEKKVSLTARRDEEEQELLYCMDRIPLLRHEVMAFFLRFKMENDTLVESVLKKHKKTPEEK